MDFVFDGIGVGGCCDGPVDAGDADGGAGVPCCREPMSGIAPPPSMGDVNPRCTSNQTAGCAPGDYWTGPGSEDSEQRAYNCNWAHNIEGLRGVQGLAHAWGMDCGCKGVCAAVRGAACVRQRVVAAGRPCTRVPVYRASVPATRAGNIRTTRQPRAQPTPTSVAQGAGGSRRSSASARKRLARRWADRHQDRRRRARRCARYATTSASTSTTVASAFTEDRSWKASCSAVGRSTSGLRRSEGLRRRLGRGLGRRAAAPLSRRLRSVSSPPSAVPLAWSRVAQLRRRSVPATAKRSTVESRSVASWG